jgi:hypothetical protein
LEVDGRR